MKRRFRIERLPDRRWREEDVAADCPIIGEAYPTTAAEARKQAIEQAKRRNLECLAWAVFGSATGATMGIIVAKLIGWA